MVEEYRKKGGHIIGEDISADSDKENKIKNYKNIKEKRQDDDENNNDFNNDDSDSDYDVNKMMKKSKRNEISNKDNSQTTNNKLKKRKHLSEEDLALGSLLIQNKKLEGT
uniref:Uncharacterized protein n=1 Tax=Apis cerana TaxID=7461 RepID=V9IKN4_APICE